MTKVHLSENIQHAQGSNILNHKNKSPNYTMIGEFGILYLLLVSFLNSGSPSFQ